jgi:hypothetical protein
MIKIVFNITKDIGSFIAICLFHLIEGLEFPVDDGTAEKQGSKNRSWIY